LGFGWGRAHRVGAVGGVAAVGLRAAVRLGAARLALFAPALPRAGFLAIADFFRRAVRVRRVVLLAAVLRFVANARLAVFLVVVVLVYRAGQRSVLDLT